MDEVSGRVEGRGKLDVDAASDLLYREGPNDSVGCVGSCGGDEGNLRSEEVVGVIGV